MNDKVHSGYVIKVGPGYPIPNMMEVDEPWIKKAEQLKFIPLQPEEGDLAVYLQKAVMKFNTTWKNISSSHNQLF